MLDDREVQAEEERLRIGRLTVRDRILALASNGTAQSGAVTVALRDGRWITVRPHTFGMDWVAADIVPGDDHSARPELAQCILPMAGVASVVLPREQLRASLRSAPDARGTGRAAKHVGLSFVLRDLCRRRARVGVAVAGGGFVGTIDRVARDHVDLAVHEADAPRRQSLVHRFVVLPLDTIVLVRF